MKTPEQIAKEIITVQPMPIKVFHDLYKSAKSKEELIKEGYKPVSSLEFMYVIDDNLTPENHQLKTEK